MQKPKYYSITASLARCFKQDFFDNEGYLLECKMFFIKNYKTKNFEGKYALPFDYSRKSNDQNQSLAHKFVIQEIHTMLIYGLIYKIVDSNANDFSFKMYVKTADEFDLFYCDKHLKINTIYYNIDSQGMVTGPFQLNNYDIPEKIKERIDQGLILIPNKKQHFEQILISKAS